MTDQPMIRSAAATRAARTPEQIKHDEWYQIFTLVVGRVLERTDVVDNAKNLSQYAAIIADRAVKESQ